MNSIVYVSTGGDILTINYDGTNHRQLTGITPDYSAREDSGGGETLSLPGSPTLNFNQFYSWPACSPDGTKVAVSRVELENQVHKTVSINIIDIETGTEKVFHTNELPALIADGVPHYVCWSPDSRSLAFIAPTPQGLGLFVSSIDSNQETLVGLGAPMYFSWAPNSEELVIHSKSDVSRVIDLQRVNDVVHVGSYDGFRVPAYSPDGKQIAFVAPFNGGGMVTLSAVDSRGDPEEIISVGPYSALLWSPDGDKLAIADGTLSGGPVFQRLRVVSLNGKQIQVIATEDIMAFYWSPDTHLLAWVGLDSDRQLFKWRVSESDRENGRDIFYFQPSAEFFMLLNFFDQYAYSHNPWSPDSSKLVVAGSPEQAFERRNGHTPTGSRIFLVDVTGGVAPLEMAAGSLGFWLQ